MQEAVVTVRGRGLAELSRLLRASIPGTKVRRDGTTAILISESTSIATMSDLMVVIVVSMTAEDECRVRLISGGGKEGLLQVAWGSERRRLSQAMAALREVCSKKSWTASTEQTASDSGDDGAAMELVSRAADLERDGEWDRALEIYRRVLAEPAYQAHHEYARNGIEAIEEKKAR